MTDALQATERLERSLARALDCEYLCRDINRALRAHGSAQRVDRCRIDRYRYRKGARALLSLQLLVGAGSLVASGTLYAGGKARRLAQRLADGPPTDGGFPGTLYLHGTRLLLQVLPTDRYLPALEPVQRGASVALNRVVARLQGLPRHAQSSTAGAEMVRYRPALSATLRLCPRHGTHDAGSVFLKIFRSRAAARDAWRNARSLQRLVRDQACPIGVQAPVMAVPGLGVLASREAPGCSLAAMQPGPATARCWVDLARRLAALHRAVGELPRAAVEGRHGAESVLDAIHHAEPALATEFAAAIRTAPRFTGDPSPCHGDLKPEHVFVDDGRTTLIDADTAAMANPHDDLALLLARTAFRPQFELGSWAEGIAEARVLSRVYLAERQETAGDGLAAALPLALSRVAAFCAQHRVSHRNTKISTLLGYARDPLSLVGG